MDKPLNRPIASVEHTEKVLQDEVVSDANTTPKHLEKNLQDDIVTDPPISVETKPVIITDIKPSKTDEEWEAEISRERAERAAALKKAKELTNESITTTIQKEVTPEITNSKKDKAKDASSVLFTDIGNDKEFRDTFEKLQKEDTRSEEEQEEDPNEHLVRLAMCGTLGMRTKQHKLLTKLINTLNENTEAISKLKSCVKELGLSKVKPNISTTDGPKVLSGDAALATVIARTKGVFRIPLYNSGFWISVKPPTLSELDSFIREVDTEFKEFGRVLGSHYHLIFNIYIKQKLMDLVSSNIINSNFDGFKSKSALMDAISLHDYDTIAWAFCTMMYSDGINIGVFCTNPECGYRDNSHYIDLAKCNYLNHDIFNVEATSWMMEGFNSKVVRTAKDIQNYKTNILKTNKTIKDTTGDNVYTLEVPSMSRFFEIGFELLNNIIETVHGEKNVNKEQLANEITYNLYKMLTPWVAKLTMLDKGVTQFITSDSKAIMESLDIGYGEVSNIYEEVENFIRDTRVCYFGITSLKCPKCGKVPNFTKDNMFVFDMEHLFFGLSYLQLGLIGTTP